MKKVLTKKQELDNFLAHYCETKFIATGKSGDKHKIYIFHTKDCVLFMAEAYIQGMRNAVGQTESMMSSIRKNGEFSEVIMVYNWSAPEPGMDMVQIPEVLINKLDKVQTGIFLRNLQRIQKDIDEGRARIKALQKLFCNEATINTSYALDGERQFLITGTKSANDRRSYAERYAEQAATNVLFDLPKALNSALQVFLPEYERGEHFIEGISRFHKKMRYGTDTHTELLLSDESAAIFINLAQESPKTAIEIGKIFQQAILDPVGLSLKYYLGKHPLIKLPSRNGDK